MERISPQAVVLGLGLALAGCYQSHGVGAGETPRPGVDQGEPRGPDQRVPEDAVTLVVQVQQSMFPGFPEHGPNPQGPPTAGVDVSVRYDESGREVVGATDAAGRFVVEDEPLARGDRLSVVVGWQRGEERQYRGIWSVPVEQVATPTPLGWRVDLAGEANRRTVRLEVRTTSLPNADEPRVQIDGVPVGVGSFVVANTAVGSTAWAVAAAEVQPRPENVFAFAATEVTIGDADAVVVELDVARDENVVRSVPLDLAALGQTISPEAECEMTSHIGPVSGLSVFGEGSGCERLVRHAYVDLSGGAATWLRVRESSEVFGSAELFRRGRPDVAFAEPLASFPLSLPAWRFADDGALIGFRRFRSLEDAAGAVPPGAHREIRLDIGSAAWSYRLGQTLEPRPPLPGERDYEDFVPGNVTQTRLIYCHTRVTEGAEAFPEETVRRCDVAVPVGGLLRLR